ncbi:histidine phosphatase family protein [Rhodanobacter sp. MP7CTX1]|uniref:histidine phosphatase family protein n=1 Tax=Rhodanobacter sp. MP7CTX1 TaxID=2723084 RepID=UPI00161D0D80|nr:histidine phosphatase family protein [Rhodanobacter sp. MP7CTX1]MBB6188679.1 serine/threonine-protein phosphatase PGAM5 [Rhodanobacter sp. MP7CTX1]
MNSFIPSLCCLLLIAGAHAADMQAPAARTIVLVRHGYYVPDPAFGDQPGPHLAPIGVAQAQLVGARLAGLPTRFDAMYVSPVQRARDTAAIIAADFPGRHFEVVNDLAECTPPTRRAEVMAHEKPQDLSACQAQLDRVFVHYFKHAMGSERTDLFVCHGNVIRYLVTRALGVDPKAWLEMSVGNASITEIRVEANGSFKVISVGDVGHLPPSMHTGATGDSERSLAIPLLPEH